MEVHVRAAPGAEIPRTRARCGVAGLLVLVAACARIGTLEGGAPDREPPRLERAVPADSSAAIGRLPQFELEFSEPVGAASAKRAVRIEPPVRFDVRVQGNKLRIRVQDSLPPDTLVVLAVGKALQDLPQRDNKLRDEITLVYATGPRLRGGAVLGRVTIKGKSEPRAVVVWEPVHRDTSHARRSAGLAAACNADGLFHLRGVPAGVPFRLRAVLDANDNLRADPDELAGLNDGVLEVAPGEVRRGVAWNVIDPNEPAQIGGVALNQTEVAGPVAVALRSLSDTTRTVASDSARAGSDSVRSRLRPLPASLPRIALATTPWAGAYARLDSLSRAGWRVVYASPRGDYSIRTSPGRALILAFVDARRDSFPGLFVRADSTAIDWEPVVWGDTLDLAPGARVRPRAFDLR